MPSISIYAGTTTATGSPAVGDEAPDFTLPDVRGGRVSLTDILQNGRAALVFYRGGWCPICNKQLARLTERYAEFQQRRVEILAISNEEVRHGKKVLDKIGPPYPLLLDQTSEVIARYGLVVDRRDPLGWILRKRAYAHPAVVLVGQDGRIQWFYRGRTYRDRPQPEHILEAADRASASEHQGTASRA